MVMTEPNEQTNATAQAPVEAPLDAANQSLSEALRSSFGVLKGIMAILVVLYLFSNVQCIEPHQEALVLRMGGLQRVVSKAGLLVALPFPIDEVVPLPTRMSNEFTVESHSFHRREDERNKPLDFLTRNIVDGLHPTLDGALLTADAGLVHAKWKVTYKFDDVGGFVSEIAGDRIESAQAIIRTYVETVGVSLALELTAEELIRTRMDYVQEEMKRRVNRRLAAIGSGIGVTFIEMYEPTPPIPVRGAFNSTQRAENLKQKSIRVAEQKRTSILNATAGSVYPELVSLLDEMDRHRGHKAELATLREKIGDLIENRAAGRAGKRIKEAGAYGVGVVSRMRSDVERYEMLLPEYKRNPNMLITRLWEETRQRIFDSPGVTKLVLPAGLKEIRLRLPLDPTQTRDQEKRRLEGRDSGDGHEHRRKWKMLGPEFG